MRLPGVINSADSVGSDPTAAQTHRQASTPSPSVCFGPGKWSPPPVTQVGILFHRQPGNSSKGERLSSQEQQK